MYTKERVFSHDFRPVILCFPAMQPTEKDSVVFAFVSLPTPFLSRASSQPRTFYPSCMCGGDIRTRVSFSVCLEIPGIMYIIYLYIHLPTVSLFSFFSAAAWWCCIEQSNLQQPRTIAKYQEGAKERKKERTNETKGEQRQSRQKREILPRASGGGFRLSEKRRRPSNATVPFFIFQFFYNKTL